MSALALALLLGAAPARGQTLRKDCASEISLLCPRLSASQTAACLGRNFENATARCRRRLRGEGNDGGGATVWGGRAAAYSGSKDAGPQASVTTAPGVTGFSAELVKDDRLYPVSGATRREIEEGMAASGLSDSIDNGAAAAATAGAIGLTYSAAMGERGCALTGARVTVFVRQTLPEWQTQQGAPPELLDWWSKLSSALKKHEDGHRDLWLAAGRDSAKRLERMAPARDCAELALFVQAERDAASADGMRRGVDWDSQTGHGKTQLAESFGR